MSDNTEEKSWYEKQQEARYTRTLKHVRNQEKLAQEVLEETGSLVLAVSAVRHSGMVCIAGVWRKADYVLV